MPQYKKENSKKDNATSSRQPSVQKRNREDEGDGGEEEEEEFSSRVAVAGAAFEDNGGEQPAGTASHGMLPHHTHYSFHNCQVNFTTTASTGGIEDAVAVPVTDFGQKRVEEGSFRQSAGGSDLQQQSSTELLMQENAKLKEQNERLRKEKDDLKALNQTLIKEKKELIKENKDLEDDRDAVKEMLHSALLAQQQQEGSGDSSASEDDLEAFLAQYKGKVPKRSNLLEAAGNGDMESIYILVANGADVNKQDGSGWSAAHYAACWGESNAVRALHKCKANLNLRTAIEYTPVHSAIINREASAIKALHECGADFSIKTNDGKTPLEVARSQYYEPIVQLLLDLGIRQ